MIKAVATIIDKMQRVQQKAERAQRRIFSRVAFAIRKTAVDSMEKSPDPAPVGKPVHTRKGLARKAVRYAADKDGAVIGPRYSIIGDAIAAHEHGEDYRGSRYPERPTMLPALEANVDKYAGEWAGSIGE